MSQSKKEILELIKGLEHLMVGGKKVMKDGKVDLNDLAVLQDLVGQQADLTAAVEGLQNIKAEEIGIPDVLEILTALAAMGSRVAAA